MLGIVVIGRGRHGSPPSWSLHSSAQRLVLLTESYKQLWVTVVISEYFKGGGIRYHEIQIMKNFGFWAPHLSNSTTLASFVKVSKASKCHLLGLFGDSKNSKRPNQSPCPERKEKHSLYLVTDWVSSSHGCRLRVSSHGNTQGMVTGEIPKKTMLGITAPRHAAGHASE